MTILRFALAPIFCTAFAFPAMAEKLSLDVLSGYINSLQAFEADFVQINSDGSRAFGKVYIERPGRARFEYLPPEQTLVIASSGRVAIFDAKSNLSHEEYPLSRTPLNLLLARDVNLAEASMVVGHFGDGDTTMIVAQDPKNPEYGSITMEFRNAPIELRRWILHDDAGNSTSVELGELVAGADYSAFLFDISYESDKRIPK
jgi:outer membrane lipoprotein-sorting protein